MKFHYRSHENVTVVIMEHGPASFEARLWVNTRNGMQDASITLTHWKGKTMTGAERFATKTIERHYAR